MALVGCSSYTEPKPNPIPKLSSTIKANINWKNTRLSDSIADSFIPVLDDSTIFTTDSDGNIYRIDSTDGSIINKFKLKQQLSSGTAVSNSYIFVTTMKAKLLAINRADGTIAWSAQLPTISIEAPQYEGGMILVKTNDSQLLAYNSTNGNLIWVYQRQNPPLMLRAYNTFQIIGNEVILDGEPSGKVALINLHTGMAIWENAIALSSGATDIDKLDDVAVRPIILNKTACAATYNGKLACFDAITSNIMWEKPFSTSYQITMDSNAVYALDVEGVLWAFSVATGAVLWHSDVLQYRKLSALAFLGGNLITFDRDGVIYIFDRNNGDLIGMTDSPLSDGIALPVVSNNGLIIQSGNGDIAKISM